MKKVITIKIINKKKVYIQKRDLLYLFYYYPNLPISILSKITIILPTINENTLFEFVEFNRKKEIIFFTNINWMLNYDDVKNLTYEEIEIIKSYILNKSENILKEIKRNTIDSDELDIKWILENYKYNSLNEIEEVKKYLPLTTNLRKSKVLSLRKKY